jgi:hypothetical protein
VEGDPIAGSYTQTIEAPGQGGHLGDELDVGEPAGVVLGGRVVGLSIGLVQDPGQDVGWGGGHLRRTGAVGSGRTASLFVAPS